MERELTDKICTNAEYMDIGENLWREDEDSLRSKIKAMPWSDYVELVRPIYNLSNSEFQHYVSCGMSVELLRAIYYASMRDLLITVWPGSVYPASTPNIPVLKSDPEFRYVYAKLSNGRILSTMLRTCLYAHASSRTQDAESKRHILRPLIAWIDRQHPDEVIKGTYRLRKKNARGDYISKKYVAVGEGTPVLVARAINHDRNLVTKRIGIGLPVRLRVRNGDNIQYHAAIYPQVWALVGAITVASSRGLIRHCGRDVLDLIIWKYLQGLL